MALLLYTKNHVENPLTVFSITLCILAAELRENKCVVDLCSKITEHIIIMKILKDKEIFSSHC